MLPARVLGRLATGQTRAAFTRQAMHRIPAQRYVSSLLPTLRLQAPLTRNTTAFSTSSIVQQRDSPVAAELTAKLDSELSMEKQMRDPDSLPSHLREYLESSDFELHDVPGKEEVIMSRTYQDEKIRIAFSIDDLNNPDEDPDQVQQDSAMMDDLEDTDMATEARSSGSEGDGAINQRRGPVGNIRVAPEDSVAPADQPELAEEGDGDALEDQPPSFTAHCYITVERPNKGALQIEAMAQDGMMVIENVYFYKDAKLADPKTREDEQAVRDLYTGPPFGNLDEDLQVLFERYLDERGINTTLALFVPEYIDFKEQREYTNWLSGVKSFFE